VTRTSGNPGFAKFTDKNWEIQEVLKMVAGELQRTPAEVALAWVMGQPGVTSTLIGATKDSQLQANLKALEVVIPPGLRARLDEVSKLAPIHPYVFFDHFLQGMIHGGTRVRAWP
jgi:aryl-alcohol dehydrogenase-like predicted oxidoreductase